MKVKSEREVAQSCPAFRDPRDCSLPGSPVHGIFQARILEWVAIAFSNTESNYKEMSYAAGDCARGCRKHLGFVAGSIEALANRLNVDF